MFDNNYIADVYAIRAASAFARYLANLDSYTDDLSIVFLEVRLIDKAFIFDDDGDIVDCSFEGYSFWALLEETLNKNISSVDCDFREDLLHDNLLAHIAVEDDDYVLITGLATDYGCDELEKFISSFAAKGILTYEFRIK